MFRAQATFTFQQRPRLGAQVGQQGVKAGGVLGNKGLVQHILPLVLQRHQVFHHAFDKGKVATNLQLEIVGADGRVAAGGHLQLVLRVGKTLQPAFAQRVQADDARAALGGLAQLTQHARVVGAGVLAKDEDGIRLLEIIERDCALAHTHALAHAGATGLVAHIGAVGEVVGAVLAHKQLVQKGGLVAGPARGVEDSLVRVGQRIQMPGHQRKGVVPGNGQVFVSGRVIDHGLRQAALVLQCKVAPGGQLAHSVLRKKIGRHPACGCLGGHGLGAVFAKLEGGGVVAVGPGTAGAIKTVRLIGRQQGFGPFEGNVLLQQGMAHAAQRAPTTGRAFVHFNFLFAHGGSLRPRVVIFPTSIAEDTRP